MTYENDRLEDISWELGQGFLEGMERDRPVRDANRAPVALHETDCGRTALRRLELRERHPAVGILFVSELGARLDIWQPDALVIINRQSLHAGQLPARTGPLKLKPSQTDKTFVTPFGPPNPVWPCETVRVLHAPAAALLMRADSLSAEFK
jgi:hypothetical protein